MTQAGALQRLATLRRKVERLERVAGVRPSLCSLVPAEVEGGIYHLLATHPTTLLSIHAANGAFLFLSPNASHFFGWQPQEVLGQSIYEFFHEEDVTPLPSAHGSVGEGVSGWIRYRLRTKGGTYRWVETRSRIQTSSEGAIYLICITHDIHEEVLALQRALAAERALVYELDLLAHTDPLTHLPNRRAAERALAQEIARSQRHETPFSVGLLDLDHFKRVNDTYGHAAGDQVLVEVARTLVETVRGYDDVVRWGGEEFLILLPGATKEEALRITERLREAVAQKEIDPVGRVTLSGGIAQFQRDEAMEACLARADAALYRAKAEGRNRVLLG